MIRRDYSGLVGMRLNDWTVLGVVVSVGERTRFRCRCVCDSEHSVDASSVIAGASQRCGACGNKRRGPRNSHGATAADSSLLAEFRIWCGMRERYSNPKNHAYKRYGGRGIRVCERWQTSFAAFLEDVGPRPSDAHSIDRFPNRDGNYEPGNVRWATDFEQARNRSSTRFLTHDGQTLCVEEWAQKLNVPTSTLYWRLQHDWPVERVLSRRSA